ncbi:FkbM family methyltransferase [Paractinoplanes rishiriensis]|uniref:FkbM family methyltransferase n=1 Tax=Paractinoplanes rishiriensis TaxID=1050105 RepID=UPI001941625D|nr:FkbM family methyltransferase [Actinoplanes rishiriensis]
MNWRTFVKTGRDHLLRRKPRLQRTIRELARRGHLPPAVWLRLHPIGIWTLRAPDGAPFLYNSDFDDDRLARHIVWTELRHWESSVQPVLFELARHAEVFLDVGAYSGIYTLLACVANRDLHAIACEPNPANLAQLRSNVRLNGLDNRVTIVAEALSWACGRGRLTIPADTSRATLRRVPGRAGTREIEVEVTTGDQLLGDGRVDLIKVDVEGLESQILAGLEKVLAAHRPTIIAECLDQQALLRVRATTFRFGYHHIYHLDGHGPVPIDDTFIHPQRCPHFLFRTEPMVYPGRITTGQESRSAGG